MASQAPRCVHCNRELPDPAARRVFSSQNEVPVRFECEPLCLETQIRLTIQRTMAGDFTLEQSAKRLEDLVTSWPDYDDVDEAYVGISADAIRILRTAIREGQDHRAVSHALAQILPS